MKKLLKKALRIKGHTFYLISCRYNLSNRTKIKTKKRLMELMESYKFINDIKFIEINYKKNCTYLELRR